MSTNPALDRALAYARHGWPVFPCLPDANTPATSHGCHDATTDEQQITEWFTSHPDANLAIATGAPGPDVLDIDQHGSSGNGYPAFARLRASGVAGGAAAWIRTPSGGMHVYFAGSDQRNGRLPSYHLDFRAHGGYVLAPPSQIRGRRYELYQKLGGRSGLDWAAVTRALQPQRILDRAGRQPAHHPNPADLARWVAAQPEGNRNNGLYWAANRVLDADPAADLSPLAAAARAAGLADLEITRTLNSARTRHPQAEAT